MYSSNSNDRIPWEHIFQGIQSLLWRFVPPAPGDQISCGIGSPSGQLFHTFNLIPPLEICSTLFSFNKCNQKNLNKQRGVSYNNNGCVCVCVCYSTVTLARGTMSTTPPLYNAFHQHRHTQLQIEPYFTCTALDHLS